MKRAIDSRPGSPPETSVSEASRQRRLAAPAISLAGGFLWGWLSGPAAVWWLAWFGLAALVWLARGPRPIRWCFVFVASSWLVSIYWIDHVVHHFGGLPRFGSVLALCLLCSALGLYGAVFGALVSRLRRVDVIWAAPAIWVALEWSRTYYPLPFPWTLAGTTWVDVPGALALSSWVGVSGLSFAVVLVAAGLVQSVRDRRLWPVSVSWGALATALVVAQLASPPVDHGEAGLRVALVQPNLPIQTESDLERILAGYGRLLALTEGVCHPGTLVVWPESASYPLNYGDSERLRSDLAALSATGCDLLVNAATFRGEQAFNSVLLVDHSGVAATADKRRLVPFGEYVPFARWLPFIEIVARGAGGFSGAEKATPIPWGEFKLGHAICYEISFSQDLAELAVAGADFFVGLSNDAWYGENSWAQHQLLRAARFRAAENRRWLVRAALTGISAVVNPRGELVSRLEAGVGGTLEARVNPIKGTTFYGRFPRLVPYASALLALFAIFRASRRTNAW